MTETNAITVSIGGKAYLDRPGSCGVPNHLWDLRILDEEGNVLPPETPGLLQCRGVGLMKEYWKNRQATLDNIDNDGWLDTGDIARIDDEGYLYIMDRAKDLIIRGGENISCAEVESAVYEHSAVKEATSFGIKEERLGEEVAVAITLKDGADLDPAEFNKFVSGRLARFKVPTRVFIWPGDLPRGATGKIPKRDVRDDIEAGKTAGVVELKLAAAKL
jgi:long-chain acyl-CoA synthetase